MFIRTLDTFCFLMVDNVKSVHGSVFAAVAFDMHGYWNTFQAIGRYQLLNGDSRTAVPKFITLT